MTLIYKMYSFKREAETESRILFLRDSARHLNL